MTSIFKIEIDVKMISYVYSEYLIEYVLQFLLEFVRLTSRLNLLNQTRPDHINFNLPFIFMNHDFNLSITVCVKSRGRLLRFGIGLTRTQKSVKINFTGVEMIC